MQNFIENLGWKKIAAAILFAIIIFFVIVLSFGSNKSSTKQTVIAPSPSSQNSPAQPSGSQITPTSSAWQTYNNPLFQIQYPQNYVATPGKTDQVINSLTLKNPEKNEIIEIQVYNNTIVPLSQVTGVFQALGYAGNVVNLAGHTAYEFKGSLPGVQEMVFILESNGEVYKLQLTYAGASPNSGTENAFLDIVKTLKLP